MIKININIILNVRNERIKILSKLQKLRERFDVQQSTKTSPKLHNNDLDKENEQQSGKQTKISVPLIRDRIMKLAGNEDTIYSQVGVGVGWEFRSKRVNDGDRGRWVEGSFH